MQSVISVEDPWFNLGSVKGSGTFRVVGGMHQPKGSPGA
jgi:hypothetical protein